MKRRSFKTFIKSIYLFCRSVTLGLLGKIFLSSSFREFKGDKINKILIIKLERLGDLVLTTPVLRELRNKFLDSYIVILVNEYNKDIVLGDPQIDETLVYNIKGRDIWSRIKFIKIIRKMHFDLIIDLTGNENMFLPVFISYLSKAKYTIGLNQYGRGFLFNIKVPYDDKYKPLAELMFDIVKPLGIDSNDIRPKMGIPEDSRAFAKEFLDKLDIKDDDLLIGIHPGGYYPSQRWTEEGFARVADGLINRYAAKVIFITSPKEREIVFKIIGLMKNKPQGILTDITVKELIGFILNLDILICNNSGPLHIAVALGIPTVSTMGPTIPQRWWPIGEKHIVIRKKLDCSPCNLSRCNLHKCMKLITAEEILEAVEIQLKNIIKIRKT